MKIKMTLISDTVFGNGMSIPGAEDISILLDEKGFPYYKASSLKGIFREEMNNYLYWTGKSDKEVEEILCKKLGKSGDNNIFDEGKIRFSDFTVSEGVKNRVLKEPNINEEQIKEAFSYIRTFTEIEDNGMTKKGSLRNCRCIKKGIIFYGNVECEKSDEELVKDILSLIKWIGTLRNRGFGKVKLEVTNGGN